MKRILIAGVGNIFHGDDAFGVEVARALSARPLPEQVTVEDYGIRAYDLAFALTDNYDAVVLVDAMPRGKPPGTVSLLKPYVSQLGNLEDVAVDAHTLNPLSVLKMREGAALCPRMRTRPAGMRGRRTGFERDGESRRANCRRDDRITHK
jgi:hydrogenase maturation protease